MANATRSPQGEGPGDDPSLAGLSPAQRRAYALGFRDCSRSRYAPGNHLEAYRIGCAAAHDRAGAASRRDDAMGRRRYRPGDAHR